MRVGLLQGGRSSEREISLQSAAAVHAALERLGHEVFAIDAAGDFAAELRAHEVEVVYIALHGRYGEDGCVQGVLELLRLPYTGSGVLASALAMDKYASKRMMAHEPAVRLAPDHLLTRESARPEELGLPVVVKPSTGGSTVGISIVRTEEAWHKALDDAFAESATVFAEAWCRGDEITVAVLDGEVFPVVRIVPESGFYDFEAKYKSETTRYEAPAALPEAITAQAQQAALAAYRAVGCRGLARVDFIAPDDGSAPVCLEINTIPGMTGHSLAPMAARVVGLSFDALVARVLDSARLDS